jgi:hypothetical protein
MMNYESIRRKNRLFLHASFVNHYSIFKKKKPLGQLSREAIPKTDLKHIFLMR